MNRALATAHESPSLVWATAALIVVIVGRATDLVPPLDGVPLVKILTVCAVLLLLVSPRIERPRFGSSTIARCVFSMAALAAASLAYSYWRGMSFAVLVGSVAAILALFVLIFRTTRDLDTFERYLKALALAGGALTLGGFLFRAAGRLSFGRTYDPNDLAFVLIAILPIALALWRLNRGWRAALWGAIAGASVWITLLTQSRGGLLGLLLACSYLAAVGAWREKLDTRLHLGRVAVGWVLLAVLAVGTWTVLPADAQERYTTMLDPTSDYNYTAEREGRIAVWGRGLHTLAAVPWGVGVGAYEMAEMSRSGYWRTAHNSFLELAVELGVLGLVVYVVMLIRAWRVLGVVLEGRTRPRGSAVALARDAEAAPTRIRIHAQHLRASMIGMLAAGLFLSQAYALVAFTIYALVAVLEARYLPRRKRGRATVARRTDDGAEPGPARTGEATPAGVSVGHGGAVTAPPR